MTENEMLERVKGADNFRKVMNAAIDEMMFRENVDGVTIGTLREVQDIMNRASTMVRVISFPAQD